MDIKEDNNFETSEVFLKGVTDFFNIESVDKKYENAIKLIQNIPDIEYIQDKDKLFYYGNVSALYYYVSNIKCKRYGLSDGNKYNADNILEDKNREYLNEILNDEINAFNYCKQGVNLELINNNTLKKLSEGKEMSKEEIARKLLEQYEKNKENFRKITQELSILYYLIGDEDKFILYGDYAVEYNSLNAINLFLKYYCDKMDFNNANYYYELMRTYPLDFYGSISNNIALKIASYNTYWKFFFDIGNYEESLKIGEDCKGFVLKYKLDNEILLYVEEHIKECKLKIEEVNNNKFTDDKLLDYFEKDIIELMSDDNKIYISTSLNVYEYIKSKEIIMDYSATLMPILKAIENIIFKIIAEKYHDFIMRYREKNYINPKNIDAFINKKDNSFIEKMKQLEIGKALNLIGYKNLEKDELIKRKYFEDFCNKNNVKNSNDVIEELYNELDELRKKRNLVAHKNRVDEECVKECYDILLKNIKFINFLYKNFRFAFED